MSARPSIRLGFVLSLLVATISHAQAPAKKPDPTMHFRDIARQSGLTSIPHSNSKRRYVAETMSGGGAAFLDCNNDGKLDIAVVNDDTIDAYLKGGDLMVTLYRQDGISSKIHFTDITKSAGLTTRGWGTAIAVADFDNDGLPDLFITGFGHNVLYHNRGNCKFEDVTERAGLTGGGFSTGAAWADYDRDGFVDLFVARYVKTDLRNLPDPEKSFSYRGVLVELPDHMEGETDLLYHNRGDGTFEEVSAKAGLNDPYKLHGMGVVWGDYDGDGWPDLFVTNDSGWNFLYHNKHNGTFEEIGVLSGTGLGPNGERYGNMAADFGDFDRDGKLDIFVTRYGDQPASLYWNQGNDQFVDIAAKAGLASPTFVPVKWGTGFGDFDNDGWPDIFIANGNFSQLMDTLPYDARYAEPIQLFRNKGDRTFQEVATPSGLNDGPLLSRRGTAFGDVNNDGRLDALVFNVNGPPSLFLNETQNANHRVLFQLIGTKSNRAAIGARVTVNTSGMSQIGEVRGGGSYNSSNDLRLHFGLGTDKKMSKVEIRWPSGLTQEFHDVESDALYEIKEGQAPRELTAFPSPKQTQSSAPASRTGIPAPYLSRLTKSGQAVVVTTPDWNSVNGTLVRFEKHNGKWQQVGSEFPIVVGKTGLGWDALTQPADSAFPIKKEGDGRSPAGIFGIPELGGFSASLPNTRMPYRQITEGTECIDDVKSSSYNKVTDRTATADWDSSEKMRTIDVYRLMGVVDYNDGKLPGAGSCIFLHIWSGPGNGTAGCTAMDETNLRALAGWLDADKHPVLIQFPAPVYRLLRNSWQLP